MGLVPVNQYVKSSVLQPPVSYFVFSMRWLVSDNSLLFRARYYPFPDNLCLLHVGSKDITPQLRLFPWNEGGRYSRNHRLG
jgi:hypothetical protein